jgi:sigma-B regulation protein RsbU (phosphoserine phosphatase)
VRDLLREIDAALERIESGAFGICETCRDNIESDRLVANPLCRNCLDHLSPDEQRALERDLDLAFQIQNGLLPKPSHVVDGWRWAFHYEPLGPVSGDYCDVIPNEPDSAYFLVGDVSGKGVAASLFMSQLYAIFRSLVYAALTPADLLSKANRVFSQNAVSSHFATVACGRLGNDGVVEFSNAGHCLPVRLHNGSATTIDSTGLPLGLMDDFQYDSHRLVIEPGDALVLYTDGLTESFNRDGEQYGLVRFCRLLEQLPAAYPEEIVPAALTDVARFRSNSPRTDDLTVLAIGRNR